MNGPRPEAIDATINFFLPEIATSPHPQWEKHWLTVRALHFLSGALGPNAVTGDDLNRLLRAIDNLTAARRLELADQDTAVESAFRASLATTP